MTDQLAEARRQRASVEAAEWAERLEVSHLTAAERVAFVTWLRESPVHVAEMLRMAQIHGALEQFERWTTMPVEHGSSDSDDNVIALADAMNDLPRSRKSRSAGVTRSSSRTRPTTCSPSIGVAASSAGTRTGIRRSGWRSAGTRARRSTRS